MLKKLIAFSLDNAALVLILAVMTVALVGVLDASACRWMCSPS
jgi:hypothetical protein